MIFENSLPKANFGQNIRDSPNGSLTADSRSLQTATLNKQTANSTLQSRLREYLRGAQIYDGETLHSFMAGVAITIALSGSQLTDIMEHIGWCHSPAASHYLKVAQVLRPGGPSELLSRNVSSAHVLVASLYSDLNSLTNFRVAFPAGPSPLFRVSRR